MRFKETSLIVRMFTEELGSRSYLVHGVRKNKAKLAAGLFLPLTQLELVVHENPKKDLNRLSEGKIHYPYKNLHQNIKKNTVALFLSEVLGKILREEDKNTELYLFICNHLKGLDELTIGIENFHLFFLYRLTHHLGIEPESIHSLTQLAAEKGINHKLNLTEIEELEKFFQNLTFPISGSARKKFLQLLLDYYYHYLSNFGEIKSLKILSEVFA